MRVAAIGFFIGVFAGLSAVAQSSVQNPASASMLQQRAVAGDAQAQFELGQTYEEGKDVPQDDAKAAEWFRKSAEQGNMQAENSLGVMYAVGRGVTRDREQAVVWLKY